ncbi:hypothetical protein MRX96_055964 [Rhipicephalus microplus]
MFPLHGRIYADCKRDLVLELLEKLKSKKKNERSEAPCVRVEERCEPLFHFFPRESEPEPFGDVLDVEMSEDEEKLEEIVPSSGLSKKGPDRDELEVCGAPDDLTDLPEDVQVNISKIKEALHSCDETDIRTADLFFMVSAKPETVAAMSLINGVVFVKCALLPKVANLEEGTTARSLIDSITAFAQDMPHVTVEGLLVPLVSAESMGKAQTDVVQTLIKEGIPKDYAAMCLRRMLQESRTCIETNVTFVHILILKRGPLESVFTELVNWLASVKDERSTDSKFSKLLMDFRQLLWPTDVICLFGQCCESCQCK